MFNNFTPPAVSTVTASHTSVRNFRTGVFELNISLDVVAGGEGGEVGLPVGGDSELLASGVLVAVLESTADKVLLGEVVKKCGDCSRLSLDPGLEVETIILSLRKQGFKS